MAHRILVIDDNREFLDFMEQLLTYEGYEVATAETAAAVRGQLETVRPDLIICDMIMPGDRPLTSLELLAEHHVSRDLPVVVCTAALHMVRTSEDWRLRPHWQLLPKPFDVEQLLDLLSRLTSLPTNGKGTAARTGPPPVLVVDDDPDILSLVDLTLRDSGYSVVLASDGREALERAHAVAPGLVLLDLTMPVLDGWQVQARLQEERPALPVVLMTAAARAREQASLHQAAGYLGKPFDQTMLLETVARFVPSPLPRDS